MSSIVHGEWIGKRIRVAGSPNVTLVGIEGVVVDETKHFFVVRSGDVEKRIPKRKTTFIVEWDGLHEVEGDLLIASPEERIKRKVKK